MPTNATARRCVTLLGAPAVLLLLPAAAGAVPIGEYFQQEAQAIAASYMGTFNTVGQNMYRSFALVMICWAGIQIALSGAFDAARFARFIMVIAFGFALTQQYTGGDWSVTRLVQREGQYLSTEIDSRAMVNLDNRIDQELAKLKDLGAPNILLNLSGALWFNLHWLAVVGLRLAAGFVVSFGYIAQAVCLLLGPIFIPFFIVPKMDWLFWGWFKAFLQYAVGYPVVASAVVYITITVLDRAVSVNDPTAGVAFSYYAIVGILAILKIPALVSSIFSGSAGSDGGLVGMAAGAVRSAVSVV
jgi:type IV secretory pathway VirB6-like protein